MIHTEEDISPGSQIGCRGFWRSHLTGSHIALQVTPADRGVTCNYTA
jgi:hypothetical protein